MLYDLGKQVNSSLQRLFKSEVTDSLIQNTVTDIIRQLIANNVGTKCVLQLKTNINKRIQSESLSPGINKAKWVYNVIFDELCNLIDPKKESYKLKKGKSQVIVFVGLQGAGKTTSICKYANYYKKKGFKTGIVCADTFRAGAFDQIKQNALKINVPHFGSNEPDPVKVAVEGVKKFKDDKFELILVDTSGRHTQENDLFLEMKEIIQNVEPNNIVFVMDAGIGQSAEQQALGFKQQVDLGSIILTKIDGAEKAGGAITSVAVTQCPIEFTGCGEGMDDLDVFDPKRFINKILGKGDLEGLADKLADTQLDEKKMLENLKSGTFRIKEYAEYLQQVLSLGPISKMASMIPGIPKIDSSADNIFKKFVVVFDSMTEKELSSNGELFQKSQSRVLRVARGSGTSVDTILQLLQQYQVAKSMMQRLSSNKGALNMIGQDPSKMSVTDKAKYQKNLSSMLGPGGLDRFKSFLEKE